MGDSCTGQQGLELGRWEPGNIEGPRVRMEEGGSWGQDRVRGSQYLDGEIEDPRARMESQGFPRIRIEGRRVLSPWCISSFPGILAASLFT